MKNLRNKEEGQCYMQADNRGNPIITSKKNKSRGLSLGLFLLAEGKGGLYLVAKMMKAVFVKSHKNMIDWRETQTGISKSKKKNKKPCFNNFSNAIKKGGTRQQERIDALTHYDLTAYDDDINILSKLFNIRRSKREWIENARKDLQLKANKYEHIVGNILIEHNVHFYHQAPFVIDGHIYFADFYLPELRLVIEVDGDYHNGMCQREKDYNRTDDLKFAGAKVVRILNKTTLNKNLLLTKLKVNGIIR